MYLQVLAIFCMSIVHYSLCYDDIHKLMTLSEIQMTFQTSNRSGRTHEVIAIKDFPEETLSRVNGKRIVSGPMWIKTFGSDIHLWLHPRNTSLIQENTPVYYAKYSKYNPENVKFEIQDGAMRRVGQLYEDPKHWASLVIGVDASGKTRVNGHLALKRLTIRSLPDKVVTEYLRTRRSIDESEYRLSNFSYHVVYPTPQEYEVDLNAFDPTYSVKTEIAIDDEIPYQLIPEILVVVENSLYIEYKCSTDGLLEYLVAFWNGVDQKFRNLQNPKINLYITAIIIGTEVEGTPYILKNKIRDGVFRGNDAMRDASTFFYNIQNSFPLDSYDIAVTLTKQQLDEIERGKMIVGKSFSRGACTENNETMISTAIVQDNGVFRGISTTAHEIGHLFGMDHDEGQHVDCEALHGYVMSTKVRYTHNSSSFSRCSIDNFELLLHDKQLSCLYNQPAITDYDLPRTMPGKMKNLTQQCAVYGYAKPCERDWVVYCGRLYCTDKQGTCQPMRIPVLEGTPCGSFPNMYCLRGRCTEIPAPTADAVRKMISTAGWIDRGKNNF